MTPDTSNCIANTPYRHPCWADCAKDLNEDAIWNIIWVSLRDSCSSELSNVFHYLMWVLDSRHGGSHTFEIDVVDWPSPDDDIVPSFAFGIHIDRDGVETAAIDAFAGTDDARLRWSFGVFDGEDIPTNDVDLSTRSGFCQAVNLLTGYVASQTQRKRQ